MRFVAGRGAIGKKLAGKSAQKPRFCARKARKWGSRRAKAHKNPDFVLEMPENGGPKGKKRTKTQILCSKCPKMGVSKAKSAQKCRFCAREERGVGNSSARNLALGGLREAPGAEAVLPKWRRRGGAAEMVAPRRKRALLLGLDL